MQLFRSTRDQRISIRGQIVAKKFCTAVKIVATQLATGCHDVDSIAQSSAETPCRHPASRGPSTVTPRHAASRDRLSAETPHRHRPSHGPSTVTALHRAFPLRKHPAVTRHLAIYSNTTSDVRGLRSGGQKSYIWRRQVSGRGQTSGRTDVRGENLRGQKSVSYTHLTLPTNREV